MGNSDISKGTESKQKKSMETKGASGIELIA